MKNFKHTPGPWIFICSIPEEGADCFWIKAQPHPAMRGFTKDVATVDGYQHEEERLANARLVASAPDMLEALLMAKEFVEDAYFREGDNSDRAEKARGKLNSAIINATGRLQ